MPGQPLDIVYPVLGDPIATALGKILAALQTIQADLEPLVVPSEFDWISDLSAGGHALTSLSRVGLENQASTSGRATGDFFAFNGNFYGQTSGGLVQFTSGGVINAAGIGGIVGDYGGANPARVTYVDASGEYVFTDDTNDWSTLQVDDIKLRASGTFVTLGAQAVASPASWLFGATPASGVTFVTVDNSGNVGAVGTIDQAITTSANITLTGSADIKTPDRVRVLPAVVHNNEVGNCGNDLVAAAGVVVNVAPARFRMQLPGFLVGERFKSVTARFIKTSGGTASIEVYKSTTGAVTPALVSGTGSTTAVGATSASVSLTSADTVATNEFFSVAINMPAGGDICLGVEVTYDRP